MKKAFVILLGLVISCTSLVKAQVSLGIDTTNYMYTDTTCYGNNDWYVVYVVNYGPQPYTGPIGVNYAVDSSNVGSSYVILWQDSVTASNLSSTGSVADSALINITPAFRSGINTVVIWPRSSTNSFMTHDSLRIPVWVPCLTGIDEKEIKLNTKLFPNPAQQHLFITNNDKSFVIEQVRIFDTEGRLLSDERFKGKIHVGALVPGIYFVELQSTSGKITRTKIIKE